MWQLVAPSLKVRLKNNRRKNNKIQCINLHQKVHFEKKTTLAGFALSNLYIAKPLLTREKKIPSSVKRNSLTCQSQQEAKRKTPPEIITFLLHHFLFSAKLK